MHVLKRGLIFTNSISPREMDKRILIPGFIIILLGASIAIYSPYIAISRVTASPGGIVLHKAGPSSTIFIAFTDITNPTNNPITVSDIHAKMLINGTDYYSQELGVDTYTIPAGGDLRVSIPVMNTGSPVQYQSDGTITRYTLDTTITMTISTSSLGMTEEKTETISASQNWFFDKTLS